MTGLLDKLRSFYLSKFYPLLVVLLIFAGHSKGLDILFGVIMISTLIVGCLICNDLRFAIVPFLCTIFIVTIDHSPNVPYYSRYYLQKGPLITVIVMAVLLIASLIYFAIKNRRLARIFPKKGMFPSLAILCGALFLNGLFGQYYTIHNFLYVSSFLFSLLVMYFLFAAYVRFDKTATDYFMYCLVLAGLLIAAQLFFAYGTTVQFDGNNPIKETVLLGWGVWTAIGGMLALLMPACFYFAANHKHGWIGYLLGLVEFIAIFLSQSRGALLVGGLVLVLCLITLCFVGANRKRNRIFALVLIGCAILGGLLLYNKILALLQNFLQYGFGDNGRFDLWKMGIDHFLQNPIFGSGFYSFVNEEWLKDVYPYFYHNTIIQFLGATGLVGFLAYAYHRFCTVRLVIKKPNPCKTFLGIGILGFLLFCLIDVLFFSTYPTMFYALMLLFMDKTDEPEEL